jgi:hypothetical protein
MQVHDELCSVAEPAIEEVRTMLRAEMIAAETLSVPLKVDIGTGSTRTRRTETAYTGIVPGAFAILLREKRICC